MLCINKCLAYTKTCRLGFLFLLIMILVLNLLCLVSVIYARPQLFAQLDHAANSVLQRFEDLITELREKAYAVDNNNSEERYESKKTSNPSSDKETFTVEGTLAYIDHNGETKTIWYQADVHFNQSKSAADGRKFVRVLKKEG